MCSYRVATEKHNPNSRTFQDIFLGFPGLWPALFQDFSTTFKQIPGLFQDFFLPKSRTLIGTKYT